MGHPHQGIEASSNLCTLTHSPSKPSASHHHHVTPQRQTFVCFGDKVLFQRRSRRKSIYPGMWDTVAEHNQPGESYAKAGARGIAEELGLAVQPSALQPVTQQHAHQLVTTNKGTTFTDACNVVSFVVRLPEDAMPRLVADAVELDGVQLFSEPEAIRLLQGQRVSDVVPWIVREFQLFQFQYRGQWMCSSDAVPVYTYAAPITTTTSSSSSSSAS